MQTTSPTRLRLPPALLLVGFVVLAGLLVLSLVGLVIRPAPIFVVDVVAVGYCLVALIRFIRRPDDASRER